MKFRWTNEEIEYLKVNYPYKDKQTLSHEMGRTDKAVQTMAVRLKIRKIVSKPKARNTYKVVGEPKFGEIKQAGELGRPGEARYIWQACKDCGKERWVQLGKRGPRKLRCYACAMKSQRGQGNPNWKGGKIGAGAGGSYVAIKLQPDDFFFSMADHQGYVLEHRLIMARKLGRCLQPWEKVHHKDGNRSHNVDSNLKLTTAGSHAIEHNKGYRDGYLQGYLDGQNGKIEELRKEIRLLQWQLKGGLIGSHSQD